MARRIAIVVVVAALAAFVATTHHETAIAPAVSLPSGEQAHPTPQKLDVVPKLSITVRVVDDGKPFADAQVAISDGAQLVTATAWTNREGVATFDGVPGGAYEISASADGKAATPVRIEDPTRVEVALVPAANVRGHIETDSFVPPNASLLFVPLEGDHAARVAAIDDAGRFAIDGIPPGRWRIEPAVPGHALAGPPFVTIGGDAPLVVHMVRTGAALGTVVDSHGAPIPYATIILRDQVSGASQQPPTLAATGMRWVHPLAERRYMPVIEPARFGAARIGTRGAECGRGHCGNDIGNIRGSVVHAAADGEVASIFPEPTTEAGKVVAIQHGNGLKSFYMHLDEIRPGLEVGQAIHAGDPVGLLGSTGFDRPLPHVHFAITHEYRGRVWYLDPEPTLRQAVVLPAPHAYEPADGAAAKEPLEAKPVVQRIITDGKGAFRVDDVPPGTYVAGVFAEGYAPGASTPFVVKSTEETSGITITLGAGMSLSGVVVGRDGPLANAIVMANTGIGETAHKVAQTMTDNAGHFTLRALAGKVTVIVQAPSYGETERDVVVDEKAREQVFSLVIQNSRLWGQILAPDGGAAPNAVVRIVDGPSRRRTTTDAQGKFAIDKVADGAYVVEISSTEFPTKRIDLKTEQWREVRLDVGGGTRVVVRDAQSASPLANARIELVGPNGATANRVTDAKGVVEVRGLVPGEWRVTAKSAGYTAVAKSTTIRAERVLGEVQLDLARGATIAGTVRDRYGRRVAGAKVTLGAAMAKTDAEGNFKIADAPVGAGVIEAEFEGTRGQLAIELSPGAERVALTIELQ